MNITETIEAIDNIFENSDMNLADYIKYKNNKKNELLNFNDSEYSKFCALYDQMIKMHESNKYSTKEKGEKLEQLSTILFESDIQFFDIIRNERTSTNEIDILLSWSDYAKMIGIHNTYDFIGDCLLCECKNYANRVDVTYVGKFFSLLTVSHAKFGVLFSWLGVTGRSNWSDAQGLIRKIALKDQIYIIDFSKEDFERIYNKNDNFYSLIQKKYIALKNDIDYSSLISKHELEDVFE